MKQKEARAMEQSSELDQKKKVLDKAGAGEWPKKDGWMFQKSIMAMMIQESEEFGFDESKA
jgi:ribosomal protein S6E (S10)